MTSQNVSRRPQPPLSEPVDVLLADVAIRIQLSATAYGTAEQRYRTLSEWIDREGSPLQGMVQLVYAQGSMAIGATIASRLTTDEHDVDFIAQLGLPVDTPPHEVLDLLYQSIRGERGSRYYDKAERRNRCVTVDYADKMHVDVTPVIRLGGRPERESLLFHSKPKAPDEPDLTLVANAFGFAEWFKGKTSLDHKFADVFERRTGAYERLMMAAKVSSEDMPDQQPVHRKSKAVIVHQLMKRWRNVRFDKRQTRKPPSVLMAKLTADTANNTETLSEELLHQARAMRDELRSRQEIDMLIRVENPVCAKDVLTDRWPGSLHEQAAFVADLDDLVAKADQLVAGCSLAEMKEIMTGLFGEAPTGEAFKAFNRQVGAAVDGGHSHHNPNNGGLNLPGSGVVAGVTAPSVVRPTPKNTFYGMERRKKR